MTAAEHTGAARQHSEQITGAYGGRYAPGPYSPGPYSGSSRWGYGYGYGSYPWYYSWDPDEEHRALAAAHRDAAEQLKLQYEVACSSVPRGLEARSPLDEFTTSTSGSDHGVVFHLSDQAGPPEVVLAQIRCHRAWLALAPNESAVDSPLVIDGVTWITHAGAEGVEVMATARDERGRSELVRRAALVVERAHKKSAMK